MNDNQVFRGWEISNHQVFFLSLKMNINIFQIINTPKIKNGCKIKRNIIRLIKNHHKKEKYGNCMILEVLRTQHKWCQIEEWLSKINNTNKKHQKKNRKYFSIRRFYPQSRCVKHVIKWKNLSWMCYKKLKIKKIRELTHQKVYTICTKGSMKHINKYKRQTLLL